MHIKIWWVHHEVLDIDGAKWGEVARVVRRVEGEGEGRTIQGRGDKVPEVEVQQGEDREKEADNEWEDSQTVVLKQIYNVDKLVL